MSDQGKRIKHKMTSLYKAWEKYRADPSNRNLRTLRGMLGRTYEFAGFTRTYVRNHLEDYPDLVKYIQL